MDIVVKWAQVGKFYGTFLIPEGAIEFFNDIGILIGEINDIQAWTEGQSKETIVEQLSESSQENFLFLPVSI